MTVRKNWAGLKARYPFTEVGWRSGVGFYETPQLLKKEQTWLERFNLKTSLMPRGLVLLYSLLFFFSAVGALSSWLLTWHGGFAISLLLTVVGCMVRLYGVLRE